MPDSGDQMVNLKRFTTQYKGADDRVLLTGEDKDGETVSLWLTQRLLLKTLPVLIDWLQKNNPADLKTRAHSEQAREMAQVFTRKPVQPRVTTVPAQPVESEQPEPGPVNRQLEPLLVSSIDLNMNPNLLRLRFRQEQANLATLAMNSNQLRQWLAVLHVLWKNAEWPGQLWPQWLSDDTKLVANEAKGTFH